MQPSLGHGQETRRWKGRTSWRGLLAAGNLRRARQEVRGHQGAAGSDGRTGDDLGEALTPHWPARRAAGLEGPEAPQPVRRTAIPKAGGGPRHLGRPPVLDRCLAQALRPVRQEEWDPTFAERRSGGRPQRRAHQAVEQAQASIRHGDRWVVDIALETCWDRVNHAGLRSRVRRRVQDRRVGIVLHRVLKAGGLTLAGRVEPTAAGSPHGGPLSPLRANGRLAEFDKALAQRGHRVARDADEANISVRRRQAGDRGLARVRRLLERKRRLKVNEAKSAVDRPWNRQVRGVTVTRRRPNRRQVSAKALKAFQAPVRAITRRTRGRTIGQLGQACRQRLRGWRAFVGFAEVRAPLRDLEPWSRRRLRSYHWPPGGRKRSRELRTRGVDRPLAGNPVKSAHGPWRLSQRPALAIARAPRSCAALGLPSLIEA